MPADQQRRGRMSTDQTCVSGGACSAVILALGTEEVRVVVSEGGINAPCPNVDVVKSVGWSAAFSAAVDSSEKSSHFLYVSVPQLCFLGGLMVDEAVDGEENEEDRV